MLRIEDICAGYNGRTVIEDINFVCRPGELTAVLGLNGTGKTTLLNVLCGLLKPKKGKVIVNGHDILKISERERAKNISLMPQRHSIIYDTKVIDVVLTGITPHLAFFETPSKTHKEAAEDILRMLKMEQYSEKNFLELSEGQKQLIIFGRTLLQNSEIMLFDEPDSSLDYRNKHMLIDKIKDVLSSDQKIGLVTLHDPNLALCYCDNIIIIWEGTIYAKFPTKDLDVSYINRIFSKLLGNVSILCHKDRYVIAR